MPLTDRDRITREAQTPRIVALWRALVALRSVVSFMNTGAHPDDEHSAMLAALRFRDGMDISYACSTRGEGGQNDIGTEATEALGTLRTAEMEAACDRLDLRMYWLSEGPDDSIFDFGFSKSGVETLGIWGRDRTLARFVHILRSERPDIICPTFLDVPGQHGHHRAMTEAAHAVMDLAADPGFAGCDLPVWRVSKLYLPAWSGAGRAYDDDLPPPPATVTVPGKGVDPVTGWSFARIGQQSRACHATQGMGHWVPAGAEVDYPLHLVSGGAEAFITDGLPGTLRDLDIAAIAADLGAAQDACDAAIAAFPDPEAVLSHARAALRSLRRAIADCPDVDHVRIGHKLSRKDEQLCTVIRLACGVEVHGWLDRDDLRPGQLAKLTTELRAGACDVSVTVVLPDDWRQDGDRIGPIVGARASDPYPPVYLPGLPAGPHLRISVPLDGLVAECPVPLVRAPLVLPDRSARLGPAAELINLATERRQINVAVSEIAPQGGRPDLRVPDGWRVAPTETGFCVTAPDDVGPGLYRLVLTLDGVAAQQVRQIRRDHITPRALCEPAEVHVRVVAAAVPEVRVGYVGGGNDRVAHWLDRMGVAVTDLSSAPLSGQELAGIDTLVLGVFALRARPDLPMAAVHDWVEKGGTLVTLYHRPWDNWDPENTPPRRLEIGQPSLRWRVTDQTAGVTLLAPDHPLLHQPNAIGLADWDGWHKERGLYFASGWDPVYKPLIAMSDAGEAPLQGAWLTADIGAGRHVHCALILHHQMEKLTPGAFRIMANLLARRG